MTFRPHYRIVEGDVPRRTMYVLHGIMGSSSNWRSFARRLVDVCPDWRLVLVDLREHGESRGATAPHTLAACAEDLAALTNDVGPADAVSGHSFGGKVALSFARDHGESIRTVFVLDCPVSAPDPHETVHSEVGRVITSLRSISIPLARRSQGARLLRDMGFSDTLAGWMATNLRRADDENGYVWRFSLDAVEELVEDYWSSDLFPVLSSPPSHQTIHMIRAADSDRWDAHEMARLGSLDPNGPVKQFVVPAAGHWLHVDNPDGLLEAMVPGMEVSG